MEDENEILEADAMKIFSKLFLTVLILSTAATANMGMVSAQTYNENDLSETPQESVEIVDAGLKSDIDKSVQELLSSGDFKTNVNEASLDVSNAVYLETTQDSEVYNSITIPLTGEFSYTSNMTIVFDQNFNIVDYSEYLVTQSETGTFEINSYSSGELVNNEVTDFEYVSDDELVAQLDDVEKELQNAEGTPTTQSVPKIAGCLASVLAVDIAVAYLIAGTCAVSCPAVPPICAACIGGIATLGAANIAGAVACFNIS